MANEQNLKPIRSESEAREKGKKGGIASGETRRARKTMRAELEALLSSPAIDKKTGQPSNVTVQESIVAALIKKALSGNTKAFEIIRDTIGEKPSEHITLAEIDQNTIDTVEKMVMAHDP